MYKKEIINEMKNYFGDDQKRIQHALEVTSYAEKLISLHQEKDINQEVIIYSAILHDIGIKNAEKKYNSPAPKYQEIEGPPVARDILNRFPIEELIIKEVCEIIGNHHSPGKLNSNNFKILYDADWLVNLPDEYDLSAKNKEEIIRVIDKLYLSEAGKRLAKRQFLS
ncbi:MAG: HD domain-containing protein [Firmicutes bacterium]|nr:HD domain-containing protein [Bacillota bacterium]